MYGRGMVTELFKQKTLKKTREKILIGNRRSEIEILGDILELAMEGIKKTHIQYKANLSFSQLQIFLKFAIEKGLLERVESNPNWEYRTTQKGFEVLTLIKEIKEYLSKEM
jgi:predicted transcriptional regulator